MSESFAGEVRRLHSERSSWIEPPLDPDWDDLVKLRWRLAVLRLDTGLALPGVEILPCTQPGLFSLVSVTGIGPFTRAGLWDYLSALDHGIRLAQRESA
jgi:hypothetical protein